MKLGDTVLPSAQFGGPVQPSTRQHVFEYDWSDETAVLDSGAGPSTFSITGLAHSETEFVAVCAACEAARDTATPLYFLRGNGTEAYYSVQTGPCVGHPLTPGMWTYQFTCITTPFPYIYDAETGERVT
jgi:hypothetical protein